MGFLDRMVADLIGDATGLPVRGLVRKVGAKRLLLGGAALAAGGFAATKLREASAAKGHQPAPQDSPPDPALPPVPGSTPAGGLPPVPGSTPGAELPPVPGSAKHADAEFAVDLTVAIARTMVAAALADGHLAEEERSAIQGNLEESDLSAEHTAAVHGDLLNPASPEALAALARSGDDRRVLFRSALLIAGADGRMADAERVWLDRFARALDFDVEVQGELERDFGVI